MKKHELIRNFGYDIEARSNSYGKARLYLLKNKVRTGYYVSFSGSRKTAGEIQAKIESGRYNRNSHIDTALTCLLDLLDNINKTNNKSPD